MKAGALVSALTLLHAAGCHGGVDANACVVGAQDPCTCADGTVGVQVCGADGTFGSCTACSGEPADLAMPDASADLSLPVPDLAMHPDLFMPDLLPLCEGKTVSTLAGNGVDKFADGSGGASGTAQFDSPAAVAVDTAGNVYVADTNANRIRKIAPDGTTTTLAGNGTAGFLDGTGGPNGTTQLHSPRGVAVDAAGNVYVADLQNYRIRKVAPDGTTTTLTGKGVPGFFDGSGGAGGTTQLVAPWGLAVDGGGNLYVGDGARVRKVAPDGSTSTLAGNGTVGFSDGTGGAAGTTQFRLAAGVAVDVAGNVYVADYLDHRVRKIASDGVTSTLAGNGAVGFFDGTGGAAGTTQLRYPAGVAVDGAGSVYVAEAGLSFGPGSDYARIRKLAADGSTTTLSGNGTPGYLDGTGGAAGTSRFDDARGIAVDSGGGVYVADAGNGRVRKLASDGSAATLSGMGPVDYQDGSGGAGGTARFDAPGAITVDSAGNVYVADGAEHRIRKIAPDGTTTTLAGNGLSGSVDGSGGAGGSAQFLGPVDVAVDAAGYLYVGDGTKVRKVAPDGSTTTLAGNGSAGFFDGSGGPAGTTQFSSAGAIAVDGAGKVYVGDGARVRKLAPDGTTTTLAGNGAAGFFDGTGGAAGTTQFSAISSLAVDGAGNVYASDIYNQRIRKISPSGTTTTLAGNGVEGFFDGSGGANGTTEFQFVYGLAIDASGVLYVADSGNFRIRVVSPAGLTSTFAASGPGFQDGALCTAEFRFATDVAVLGKQVFIADLENRRIRKVQLP
jgi:hypothetical protein